MMVRSAAKSVSNTLSKPRRCSAVAILPVTSEPIGMPNSSPSAARTAGAGCTTTNLSGSPSAAHTLSVSSFSVSAPVGQASMHWPQLTQAVVPSGIPQADSMAVLKPRFVGPMTPTFWIFSHMATQRRQHALVVVADDRRRHVVDLVLDHGAGEAVLVFHAVLVAQALQLAVGGAHAGQALFVVGGEQQLQVDFAGLAHGGRVGFDLHALAGGQHAGRRQRAGAGCPPRTCGRRRFR